MKQIALIALLSVITLLGRAQSPVENLDKKLPVRGFAIAAPSSEGLNLFLKFIEEELAPAHFNMLILRVDYNYAYESHPELRNKTTLSKADVKRIVALCKKYNIQIAPQINLLGHQSWASTVENLLKVYPQFDETPHVKMPEKYEWPNPDGLYCKSYCPLHPDVHKVVFALMDELMDVFETNWFHAGMDEVFYIGDDKCPRCGGHDKAELFAGELTKIQNHLNLRNGRLMIWGDRLIDGKTTGLGMWEASMNQTYRAIDLIPKDVFICDWHYERADLTPVYFAMKGFDVATCPWRNPDMTTKQVKDMLNFRQQSTPEMKDHFKGMIQTIWTGADAFLKEYYDPETYKKDGSQSASVKTLINEYKKLSSDQILVLTEHGGHHELFTAAALKWLKDFATTYHYEITEINNTKLIDEKFLADYKVFIQLDYPPYMWTDKAQAAFIKYIDEGRGGWVGFHHATLLGEFDGYPMWNWFSDFMGSIKFKNYIAAKADGKVIVEDKNHPVMKNVQPSFILKEDEWYIFDKSPRPNVHVLANVDESSYKPASDIKMGDHPVIWINEHKKARNVYFLVGHSPVLLDDANFTTMFKNAILWTAGK